MDFEWDDEKNAENVRKHKIDFADAIRIFDGPVHETVDDRYDYGELRLVSTGLLYGVTCIVVTHTDRNGKTRIISARKADKDERTIHDGAIFGQT